MIDIAIKHGLDKVQLVGWFPYDKAMVDRCHAHGIKVNFCQADTPEDAKMIFNMGVDCVLTNDYHSVKAGLDGLL
jgi:glycerophosphoryl diester phosphodiesterase